MEILDILLFVALGVVTGVASGFFGIGGGLIIVPSLLLMGYSMPYAIGISIMQMVFSSIFGSIFNIKAKKLDIKDGIFVGIGGLLGASFSGLIVSSIPSFYLMMAFVGINIFALYKFAFKIKVGANPNPKADTQGKKIFYMIASGFLVGIFAISLGIGGGLLLAPLLAYYLGFDSKKTVPIALFFIIFASLSGSISLINSGIVDIPKGAILGISAILGVYIGGKIMDRTSVTRHHNAVILMYIFSISATIYKMFNL